MDNELNTEDYKIIQRYIGIPLIRIGLGLLMIDAIGYILRGYYIFLYPPVDPFEFKHGLIFIVGVTVVIYSEILIFLDKN